MADLTISVPDAVVPRIRAAFGKNVLNADGVTSTWVPATVAELRTALKDYVRGRVIEHETTQAAVADRVARDAETRTW